MKRFMITFVVVALLAFAMVSKADIETEQDEKLQLEFVDWMRVFNKSYSMGNFFDRYAKFRANSKSIKTHNEKFSKGEVTYKVTLNQFADLSADEFRSQYTRQGLGSLTRSVSGSPSNDTTVGVSDVAASIDWRQLGKVTDVKNQGQCGSCWAFSAAGSMEGAHALQGTLESFSEQMLVDCVSGGNFDCSTGGLMDDAFTYVISNGGTMLNSAYPYTATDRNTCRFQRDLISATFSYFRNIPVGDETALKAASAVHPGVSVGVDATGFQFYSGGVFNPTECGSGESDVNHGVVVVGYGTDPISGDYWIIKNSWGASWGENGYIRLARNQNNKCGVATMASYIVA